MIVFIYTAHWVASSLQGCILAKRAGTIATQQPIAEEVLPGLQGRRAARGTTDMIFTMRQLKAKNVQNKTSQQYMFKTKNICRLFKRHSTL